MIPNDQPLRRQTIHRMLYYLVDEPEEKDLTSWERDFIHSIFEQFQHRLDLTNKQCEILERIYDK
jgi:hypothetical protein